jgi:hypothetical protein
VFRHFIFFKVLTNNNSNIHEDEVKKSRLSEEPIISKWINVTKMCIQLSEELYDLPIIMGADSL